MRNRANLKVVLKNKVNNYFELSKFIGVNHGSHNVHKRRINNLGIFPAETCKIKTPRLFIRLGHVLCSVHLQKVKTIPKTRVVEKVNVEKLTSRILHLRFGQRRRVRAGHGGRRRRRGAAKVGRRVVDQMGLSHHFVRLAAAIRTKPFALGLGAQLDAAKVEPLDFARVIVAHDHLTVGYLVTRAVERLVRVYGSCHARGQTSGIGAFALSRFLLCGGALVARRLFFGVLVAFGVRGRRVGQLEVSARRLCRSFCLFARLTLVVVIVVVVISWLVVLGLVGVAFLFLLVDVLRHLLVTLLFLDLVFVLLVDLIIARIRDDVFVVVNVFYALGFVAVSVVHFLAENVVARRGFYFDSCLDVVVVVCFCFKGETS